MIERLSEDPETARMQVDDGLFPSMKRANRRLNMLVGRKLIRRVGHAYLNGSWQCVYFAGTPFGANMVQHHAEVTLALRAIDCDERQRWEVAGEADGYVRIGELEWLFEHDRGHENRKQVLSRTARLAETGLGVLWTAPTMARVRQLIRWTEAIAERCLYATFAKALTPHENVWLFADGTTGARPRRTRGDAREDASPTRGGED